MEKNQARIIIENIKPQIDGGIFPIRRVMGETVHVTADIFSDGHDLIKADLLVKHEFDKKWTEVSMHPVDNDQWTGAFTVAKQGWYTYCVEGWVDHALTWQKGTELKIKDSQKVKSEILEGVTYLQSIEKLADPNDKKKVKEFIKLFKKSPDSENTKKVVTSKELKAILGKYPLRLHSSYSQELRVYVDINKALFSTWYEFFPRSSSPKKHTHGTFKDCIKLLPRIANMGFDVLYFPPIHPIGEKNRKGKNNSARAEKGDPGSPWAIGSRLGGHKDIHPELGSLKDFKLLIAKAKSLGIDIAMDIAFQVAPDHPYVKAHPEWFKWRPDGTIQYAENPPKKYQDILPFYFETEDWKNLWNELLSVFLYWIEECGVKIFRIDNPHTKPFMFWGWLIEEVKKFYPDTLFLSEAFTRPKIMMELAKQGFTQSYTYFAWRVTKNDLAGYLNEITGTEVREYFRPNFWPNTPDINPYHLQGANESTYLQRYFLSATLSSNTGLYGPTFELMISDALVGKEEYLNSEKYEIRNWDWNADNKIIRVISIINKARKENASLQQTNNIEFCETDNDMILSYCKFNENNENLTLMVINLDSYYSRQGWIKAPLHRIGITAGQSFHLEDLITHDSYIWDKEWNFVELHPTLPFHLFKITKK